MRPSCLLIAAVLLVAVWGNASDRKPAGGSLADAARKEKERREQLEQQRVEGKVVESPDFARLAAEASVSVSSPQSQPPREGRRGSSAAPTGDPRVYRTRLQRLDREVRQAEDRLTVLRSRLESRRRNTTATGRGSGTAAAGASAERIREQIQEGELKLRRLREERRHTWEEGRKAGFLPGELDGRGIIP